MTVKLPRLRRRAPDPPTVTAEATTDEWPALSSDHTFDFTADDFARPPLIDIPPEFEQLGAWLEGMTPERRAVLLASSSANGSPWWAAKWEECEGGWPVFLALCAEVFAGIDEGRPAALVLCAINTDLGET